MKPQVVRAEIFLFCGLWEFKLVLDDENIIESVNSYKRYSTCLAVCDELVAYINEDEDEE